MSKERLFHVKCEQYNFNLEELPLSGLLQTMSRWHMDVEPVLALEVGQTHTIPGVLHETIPVTITRTQ